MLELNLLKALISPRNTRPLAKSIAIALPAFVLVTFIVWHFRHQLHNFNDQIERALNAPTSDNAFFYTTLPFIVLIFSVFLVAPLMLRYLRYDPPKQKNHKTAEEISEIWKRVSARSEERALGVTSQSRNALIADIKDTVAEKMGGEFQESLRKTYGPALDVTLRAKHLRSNADRIEGRLEAETRALMRRGNLNLVLGTVTTALAALILGYVALTARLAGEDWHHYLPVYFLRLSVAIFIEVFAFFFLRLYRASLGEIKYFQNEITNLEAKFLALEYGILSGDKLSADAAVQELARTERNFIIKKDETTIELEKARLESRQLHDFLSAVKGFIPTIKQNSE